MVEPLIIQWDCVPLISGEFDNLPSMRVDVFLRNKDRKIIIDTKYYAEAIQNYHGIEKFHSGNLYQIFSYLKNAASKDPAFQELRGYCSIRRCSVA
jgi:5-methylcytosine-specific restriction enzyme subunit McrC